MTMQRLKQHMKENGKQYYGKIRGAVMITRIKDDMKQAMKDKAKTKLSTLRMLLATIETERGKLGLKDVAEFTEEQIIGLINRNIKALNQEIESLVNAGRETVSQEEQKAVLMTYLPKQLTEEEILKKVTKAVALAKSVGANFGAVMGHLSDLKGKADMGKVSKMAKEIFNK